MTISKHLLCATKYQQAKLFLHSQCLQSQKRWGWLLVYVISPLRHTEEAQLLLAYWTGSPQGHSPRLVTAAWEKRETEVSPSALTTGDAGQTTGLLQAVSPAVFVKPEGEGTGRYTQALLLNFHSLSPPFAQASLVPVT